MASTLQEALAQANKAGLATINLYSRIITLPPNISVLGVQSDDDVFRIWFTMPKIFGDVDLSTYAIRVNYLNANNEGDIYVVNDQTVENDYLVFSWLVGRSACTYQGNVKFIICFKLTDSDGTVTNEFNTAIATLPVLNGIEPGSQIVEQYPDIIEEILSRLDTDEAAIGGGVKSVNGQTGEVTLTASDVGAVPSEDFRFPVTSVNEKIGDVTLTLEDLGAASEPAVTAINNRMLDTISRVTVNQKTGSMELWTKDLDNYTTSGFYNAITCTNSPYQYAALEVIGYYMDGYCIQRIWDVTTRGAHAERQCINGTWTPWDEDDNIKFMTSSGG